MGSGLLVTIGIAVYNGAAFLSEALESAFRQTHTEIEIMLYNDGSTDATLDIAKSYRDHRLTIIDAGLNSGVAAGRQVIKTLARGDYLTWLDADDRFLPERIAHLLDHAKKTGADLVCDTYRCIDEAGACLDKYIFTPDYIVRDDHFTRLFERNRMMPHPLVRRKCFESIDYDLTLPTSEDYDYWLKCSWNNFIFSRLDEVGLEYRVVSGSLSSNNARSREFTRKIFEKYPVEEIVKLYRKRGYDEGTTRSMACLQFVFRQQYDQALEYARLPWGDLDGLDQDFYLGTLLLKLGDLQQAISALANHLARFPDSPAGLNNMGIAQRRLRRDAADWFMRAIKIFPGYQDARDNLENPELQTITLTQLAAGRVR